MRGDGEMLIMSAWQTVEGEFVLAVVNDESPAVKTDVFRGTLNGLVAEARRLERADADHAALAWAETLAPTIWQHRNRAWWRLEMVIKRRRKELFGHV